MRNIQDTNPTCPVFFNRSGLARHPFPPHTRNRPFPSSLSSNPVSLVGVPALAALIPVHAVNFFLDNGVAGFFVLGAVFLVVTGTEALYADMGHFGRKPIERAWFRLVLPALVLNYMGQGAMLLEDPSAIDNPFYNLVPRAWVIPLVVLATVATVIASQALISGAFSLTRQAVQLGYAPRLRIRHTSEAEIGQIYVPVVNWVLMLAAIGLVIAGDATGPAITLALLGTLFIIATLFALPAPDIRPSPWFHLFGGAAMLGAFFIATDPVTAATTPRGQLIYGAGIGILIYVIRTWGGYPDAVAFAVLLMNMATPTIDYYTQPRVFGHEED